jgi:hypothetical protein
MVITERRMRWHDHNIGAAQRVAPSGHFQRFKPAMSQTPPRKKPSELRSQQWFGRQDRDGFAYRSWVKGKGVPHDQFDGRR